MGKARSMIGASTHGRRPIMTAQGTGIGRPNALKRPIEVAVEADSAASTSTVYELLADPASHVVWGGERQGPRSRLLTMEAPPAPIGIGDEFSTTGADPMGGFADRSVVTDATPSSTFEFVTEATFTTKKGASSVWTVVHRYALVPTAQGCRISYTLRITRISDLPGVLRIFNWPVLSPIAVRASSSMSRKGVENLAAMAEERAAT
jgi:hypothetical protein